jgi:hypothetical protein
VRSVLELRETQTATNFHAVQIIARKALVREGGHGPLEAWWGAFLSPPSVDNNGDGAF